MLDELLCFLPLSLARICTELARSFDVSGQNLCVLAYPKLITLLLEHPEQGPVFCYVESRMLFCYNKGSFSITLLKETFDDNWTELMCQMNTKLLWHSSWAVFDLEAGVAWNLDGCRYFRRHTDNMWMPRNTLTPFSKTACILDNHHLLCFSDTKLRVLSIENGSMSTTLRGHTGTTITRIAAAKTEGDILAGCEDGNVHLWLDWKQSFFDCQCTQNPSHCADNPRHMVLERVHASPILFVAMLPSYFVSADIWGVWLWKRKSRSPWLHFKVGAHVDAAFETCDGQVLLRRGHEVTLLNPHGICTTSVIFEHVMEIAQLSNGSIVVQRLSGASCATICSVHT